MVKKPTYQKLEQRVIELEKEAVERRQTEEALRKREERYRLLIENANEAVISTDIDGKMLVLNKTAAAYLGGVPKDYVGKTLWDVFPKEVADVRMADNLTVIQTGKSQVAENALPFQGETRYFLTSREPIKNNSGEVISVLTLATDITEQKQVEEALRESEERYSALFDRSLDCVYIHDFEGNFLDANPAALKLFGYTKEEILSLNFGALLTEEQMPTALQTLEELKEKGYQRDVTEFRLKDKEGNDIHVETIAAVIYHGTMPYAVQGIARDVTERKLAEEALQESEEKFRLLAEQSLLGIVIIQDGLVKYVNEVACEMTEYSIEEALDWKPNEFGKLFHPDDLGFVMEQAQKKQEGAEDVVTHYSYRMLTKSGKVKWVDQYSKTITFGRKTADLITIIDITERKRIEEEFSKIEKLESLGMLAGGLAHDFNNILTTIMGNISLAKMDADRGSNLYESLEEAEKASQRATNLTQQLLTFAKGGAPVKETASLAEVVRESTSFVLRGSKVRADFVIPEGLWAAEIDVGQMNQVINNLVINADQAMPEGGVIRIQAENIFIEPRHALPVPPGKYVKISIKDEGIGIAGSHLQKIFDPYFSTKQKGSGLGLATVHSIVNKHDGHIAADSEVGVGTTFDIYLPASKKELAETKEVDKEIIKGQGKVLVMDDEESIRSLARQSLHRLGYEIELAADGDEAIAKYEKAKLSQNPYDAVILDLTIPGGLGGKECIQKLREIDPEVKAIVASGYADDPVMANFGDYGFTLAVTKPFSVEKLGQALRNVLTGSYKK